MTKKPISDIVTKSLNIILASKTDIKTAEGLILSHKNEMKQIDTSKPIRIIDMDFNGFLQAEIEKAEKDIEVNNEKILAAKEAIYNATKNYSGKDIQIQFAGEPRTISISKNSDLYKEKVQYTLMYNGAEL